MDHGSQYLSDHFLKQIRYWGIHPSFGFVEEPETNGVAERWNRTLKEQAIHGRIFQNLEAVRAAVADFVERYNQTWRLEKLGYHTPIEAREEYEARRHSTNVCPGNRVRYRWKKASGSHQHARVENAFFRYTSIVGDCLRARSSSGQRREAVLACHVLNRMTELGRPVSYRIGR